MAEIHIERKTGVWHWIGALVLVLLLGWTAFAVMQKRGGTEGTRAPAVTAPASEPGAQDAAGTSVDATAQPSPPPADDDGAPSPP